MVHLSLRPSLRPTQSTNPLTFLLVVAGCMFSGIGPLPVIPSLHGMETRADDASARDLRLGKGLYDQGLFDRAIPPLERVRSGNASATQREEALFLLGEAYRSLDRLEEAEARFGELLRRAPRSEWATLAQLGRGESLVRLDRAREAVPLLEAATRGAADDAAVAHYWLAEAQVRLGDLEAAIEGWSTLVRTAPAHELAPYAAYNAALRCREQENPKRGLDLLDALEAKSIEAAMRDRLHLLAGELALAANDPQRSLREYGLVRGDESRAAALAGTAWAAKAAGDSRALSRARRKLTEDFGSSPERLEVDLLYGSARAEAGDVDETESALARHRTGPRRDEATFWCAWARRIAGRSEEAARRFASIEGDGEWAARGVLRAEEEYRKAEQWEKSLEAARRFISNWRDDPRASAVVAGAIESSYRLGDDERVIDLEQSFLERWPNDPLAEAVRHYAAEAALRREDPAAAIERFAALWRDATRRPTIAARYAWALATADPAQAPSRIAPLLGSLEGEVASEVGVILGRAHLTTGDRKAALAAFRAAAASDPRGESGARARLEEAILLGSAPGADAAAVRAAEKAYRAVLAATPSNVVRARARIDLATLLAERGDDRGAQPEFARYLDDHEEGADRADAWLGLAFCRWRLDDLDGALAAVHGLRSDTTGSDAADLQRRAEALYIEGRVEQQKGDPEAATRALSGYLANHTDQPRTPEVLRELARIAEERGRTAQAISFLERRLADHGDAPATDEARYRLAWLLLSEEKNDAAAKQLSTLVERHPKSEFAGDAHFRLGEIAYASGDQARARREFTEAIESSSGDRVAERARYRIGWSYRKSEEWSRAGQVFEELAAAHPDGELAGEALYLAADAAERAEKSSDARRLLERLLDRHPTHERSASAKIRLAEALTGEKEWQRIRTLLDPLRAARLEEPWQTRHRIALGRALVRLGKGRSAVPILTEALDEGGARAAEAQFEIGLAYRDAGDRDRAIEAFIHGPVLYPFKPWAVRSHLEAGRDLLAAGKRKEATRLLELAIEQDPKGPYGKEAKQMLTGKDSF